MADARKDVMKELEMLQQQVRRLAKENRELKAALSESQSSDLLAQIEQMKNCENCDNGGKDHRVEPLKHCSRITVFKTAEQHLHKDMWILKS